MIGRAPRGMPRSWLASLGIRGSKYHRAGYCHAGGTPTALGNMKAEVTVPRHWRRDSRDG